MNNQAIVFKNDEGGISVIHPSDEALRAHTVQEVARKDVPAGKPYAIVDISELPADRLFRGAWTIEDGDLVDGTGNTSNKWE